MRAQTHTARVSSLCTLYSMYVLYILATQMCSTYTRTHYVNPSHLTHSTRFSRCTHLHTHTFIELIYTWKYSKSHVRQTHIGATMRVLDEATDTSTLSPSENTRSAHLQFPSAGARLCQILLIMLSRLRCENEYLAARPIHIFIYSLKDGNVICSVPLLIHQYIWIY